MFTPILELLAPDRCVLCDGPVERPGMGWCDGCLGQLPRLEADRCAACGAVWPSGAACGVCRREGRPWSGVMSVLDYEGVVPDLMARWKYPGDATISRPMARLFTAALEARGDLGGAVVVPVPQAGRSWARRGFSPAVDLARAVGRRIDAPVVHALARVRGAPAQGGLTAAERRRNVARLFRAAPGRRRELRGGPVLLVDDVATTTSTASACAAVLREAGAASVAVATLVRARGEPCTRPT